MTSSVFLRASPGAQDCPACKAKNPADARFCLQCGRPLAAACARCGAELPVEARFCPRCGTPVGVGGVEAPAARSGVEVYVPKELLARLEAARASGGPLGERRVVTILFSDVQGSTAAAEKVDPEEWAEIMNGVFGRMMRPVQKYDGTVVRMMGDAILAFFGAPVAHEDDPQRAALAGLEIVDAMPPYRAEVRARWGLDFNVRVGINTGLVVVGEVGTDLRAEYTALGDAVNLAARMEQTAQPGTVQIAEPTYRLVSPLFEVRALGGVQVKGKSEPVPSYVVLAPKAQPGRVRGIEGLSSPLVGRDREMQALFAAVDSVRRGSGRIVSIMGEAGLGKSRVAAELRQRLEAEGAIARDGEGALLWYEGRSRSYEASTPYAPFVDLLSRAFGFQPGEPDAARRQKVAARAAEVLGDRAAESAPFLMTLLGLTIEGEGEARERVRYLAPPQIRGAVFAAVADWLEALAARRPVAVVIDDLHWADPTSLDLLTALVPLADRAALLIAALFRPQRQEPAWRFHETASRDFDHRYTAVTLQPLDETGARTLVSNLLHIEGLPEKVRRLILEKAEGNPFFVEEVIRSLLDSGVVVREADHFRATRDIERISVPDTLAGVLTTRLDALPDAARRVAQSAAVLGREFGYGALAAVHGAPAELDDALAELQRRGLLREKARLPERAFLFKHGLVQEAAYGSLLLARRRVLHRRAAEALEKAEPRPVNEIARHFLEAREPARALPWLVEAGDLAARAYATPEAIGWYTRALEVARAGADLALARRAFEGSGAALDFGNDVPRAIETYREMAAYGEGHGDLPMKVSALNKLGALVAMRLGQLDQAERTLLDSEQIATSCADRPGLAEVNLTFCMVRTVTGELQEAMERLSRAAEISRGLELKEQELLALTHLASTLAVMARFDEAWETAGRALALARELDHREHRAELMSETLPLCHLRLGEVEAARASAAEGLEVARRIGSLKVELFANFTLAQIALHTGEYERALHHSREVQRLAQATGYVFYEPAGLCMLGRAWLDTSDALRERVVAAHREALQMLDRPMGEAMAAHACVELGFCALRLGAVEAARAHFERGLRTPSMPRELARPRLLCGLALVALAEGRPQEAAPLVDEARRLVTARAMRHEEPFVDLTAAEVSAARGSHHEGLQLLARAEEAASRMGLRPLVWEARLKAARLLSAAGRSGEAEAARAAAREAASAIAALLQDPDLRDRFTESASRALA